MTQKIENAILPTANCPYKKKMANSTLSIAVCAPDKLVGSADPIHKMAEKKLQHLTFEID